MQLTQRWAFAWNLLPKACNYTVPIRLLVRNDSQRSGGVEGEKSDGWMEFTFKASSLRCPQTKISSSHLWRRVQWKKTSWKWRENMISQRINDYCLIMWPVTLYFSTNTQNLPVIPGQGLSMSCLLCPWWDPDDASFIAPNSSPEQGDSSTAGSHREHQLCCETLSFKYNLFCGVALWQSWEFESHTQTKNPLWQQGCWDVVSGWHLNCSFRNTITLEAWDLLQIISRELIILNVLTGFYGIIDHSDMFLRPQENEKCSQWLQNSFTDN